MRKQGAGLGVGSMFFSCWCHLLQNGHLVGSARCCRRPSRNMGAPKQCGEGPDFFRFSAASGAAPWRRLSPSCCQQIFGNSGSLGETGGATGAITQTMTGSLQWMAPEIGCSGGRMGLGVR